MTCSSTLILKQKMNESRMLQAISAVRQRHMKIRHAALEFGVPKSTLSDRLANRWKSEKPGPSRELTDEEEVSLVKYLQYMSKHGFPMTRAMARRFIIQIVKISGRQTRFNTNTGPSNQWFRNFFERNPELREIVPLERDRGRAGMSNGEVMDPYINMLDEVLQKNSLQEKPSQVFYCDETRGTGNEASRTKVIGDKPTTSTRRRATTNDHVTAHVCICADGHFLPSMVIFKGAFPHRKFREGIPETWGFVTSECGSMDTALFQIWFEKIFLPHCGSQRPVILVMDNHDSHISLPVIEKAIENNVILMGLPTHTTNLLQPLDEKLIGPLEAHFATIANTSTNTTVGKSKFPIILKYAIDQTTPESIHDAFEVSGLYPCNRQAISTNQQIPPSFSTESDQANNSSGSMTCETCGTNPQSVQGLIPQQLATILVPSPVQTQPKARKRRIENGESIRKQNKAKPLRVEQKVKRLESVEQKVKRLESVEQKVKRLESVEQKVKRLESVEQKVKRLESVEQKVKRLESVEQKVKRLEKKLKELEEKANKKQKREELEEDEEEDNEEEEESEEEEEESEEEEEVEDEEEERQKKADKKIKKAMEGRLADRMYTCAVCGVRGRVNDEVNGIMWYGCDESLCNKWYHADCLSEGEREYVNESISEGDIWYCISCK